jgi:hypothetical protein
MVSCLQERSLVDTPRTCRGADISFVQGHLNSFLLTAKQMRFFYVATRLQLAGRHALGSPLAIASLAGFMVAKAAQELVDLVRDAEPENMRNALVREAKLRGE